MKLFITGASGLLGRAITRKLLGDGNKVTALLLPHDENEFADNVTVVRGDITDPTSFQGKIQGHDAIIHCAGIVDFRNWNTCIALNLEGTRNVAREAVRAEVRRFIHISSVSIYGWAPGLLIDENTPRTKCGNAYGDTKIDSELILEEFERQGQLDVTILRASTVYSMVDECFLSRLVPRIGAGTYQMVGDGSNTVDLVSNSDLASVVASALREGKSIGQIYLVTNPHSPTWGELLDTIASEIGCPPIERRNSGRRAHLMPRTRSCRYDVTKVATELGFRPSIGTLEGVARWIRARQ